MGGLIIAGDRSGTGKTTVTLALLAALADRLGPRATAQSLQSFKVGPDYIDPMFHRAVTGHPCYNLDPVLTSATYVQTCYQQHATTYTVVEGVMGLFDGADTASDIASTAHVARLLDLPVVLVVDCSHMSRSVAALVVGYQQLDPRVAIAGVILNRVGSDRHLAFLHSALHSINVPILGIFRRETDIALPDRHLGLVPVGELDGFQTIQHRLAALGERSFDWPQLETLFQQGQTTAPPSVMDWGTVPGMPQRQQPSEVAIAVAYDRAFNFYYPTNLALLQQAGARLQYWSPMADPLPDNIQGLYLGGGFPEVFSAELSANHPARQSVRQAIAKHLPTYAECGGLMYLCKTLIDFDGRAWPMVNSLHTTVSMGGRLSLGYRNAQTLSSGPLLQTGETVTGHEFHRSRLKTPFHPSLYRSERAFGPGDAYTEGTGTSSLHASYLHLHWGTRPEIPQRFVMHCQQWHAQRMKMAAP
ncbi:MAG: cobyrinate a,c-diamide synthase [Cyanobacteria bacterium J06632_22]